MNPPDRPARNGTNGIYKVIVGVLIFSLGIVFTFVISHSELAGHPVMVERVTKLTESNVVEHGKLLKAQDKMMGDLQEIKLTLVRIEGKSSQ